MLGHSDFSAIRSVADATMQVGHVQYTQGDGLLDAIQYDQAIYPAGDNLTENGQGGSRCADLAPAFLLRPPRCSPDLTSHLKCDTIYM